MSQAPRLALTHRWLLVAALACWSGCDRDVAVGAPSNRGNGGSGGTAAACGGVGGGPDYAGSGGHGGSSGGNGGVGTGGSPGGNGGVGTGGGPGGVGSGGNAAAAGAGGAGSGGNTTAAGAGGAGAGGSAGRAASGGSAGGATAGAGGTGPSCGTWTGDFQAGSPMDEEITAVTAFGNTLYVTGYEHGVVSGGGVIPSGDARAVIARYDAVGALSWKAIIDTPETDTAEDVQIDPATGNAVVAGRTSGALPGFVNGGQTDMYVAVLDSSGQRLGAAQLGDERPQHPVKLALGSSGQVLVAGYDDTYATTSGVVAVPHGFLASFTLGPAPGYAPTESFWQRSAYLHRDPVSGPRDFTNGVAIDRAGDGAAYLPGIVDGAPDVRGMYVTKVDRAGQGGWLSLLSPAAADGANAAGVSPTGDLFVAGAVSLQLGAVRLGQQDAVLLKVDKATGTPLWIASAGSPETDYPTALAFDAAGNVYMAGVTLGAIAGGAPYQGGLDAFVVKFSPSGAVLGVWQRGTLGDDVIAGIAVDACGRVFVGGYTTDVLVPGQANAGGRDMFLMRVDL